MGRCVKPNIIQKFSGLKVQLWSYFEEEIGNQNGPFEVNQTKLAEKFDVSRKSIQNALKTFISANLMEKVESRTGRGVHSLYQLIWTFREQKQKSATPSRVYSKPQEKNITKGSKTFRYYAYKFRKAVENSNLAKKAGIIVGKILNYLEGKTREVAKSWLIYLRRWLNGPKRTLKDFFVYLHRTLKELEREKLRTKRDEKRIKEMKEKREEIKKDWQEDPPPRLCNCGSLADYQKAIEDWHEESKEPAGS